MNNKVNLLYLSKEKNQEVFVDISDIEQYQIEGIRFLYLQYKKRKSGVIFNDPRTDGRIQQIVLFVNALKNVLEKPVLVLCHEEDTSKWLKYFKDRIEAHSDVTVENSNPYIKNMVYINAMKNLDTFCSRGWGIVVVSDDGVSKQISKTSFKADFKIWITDLDMKHNLQIFSFIHQWIFGNDGFVVEDYVVNENHTKKDALEKAILLDAFLEDIVIRRNHLSHLTNKLQKISDTDTENMEKPEIVLSKVTRKNKDATGTKIKRTKRKLEVDSSTDTVNDKNTTCKDNKIAKIDNETANTGEKAFDNYIANNEPSTSNNFHHLNVIVSNDNGNYQDFAYHYDVNINNEGHCSKFYMSGTSRQADAMVLNINIPSPIGCSSPIACSSPVACPSPIGCSSPVACSSSNQFIHEDAYVMDVDFDEKSHEYNTLSFKDAIQDIVENENGVSSSRIDDSQKCPVVSDCTNEAVALVKSVDNEKMASKNTMNIDVKISEMEEKAMKKFKGSVLDTIF